MWTGFTLSDGENYFNNKYKKIAPFDTKIVKRGYQEIIDNSNSIRRENKVRQKTFLTNLTQKKFLFRCRIWMILDCS